MFNVTQRTWCVGPQSCFCHRTGSYLCDKFGEPSDISKPASNCSTPDGQ